MLEEEQEEALLEEASSEQEQEEALLEEASWMEQEAPAQVMQVRHKVKPS